MKIHGPSRPTPTDPIRATTTVSSVPAPPSRSERVVVSAAARQLHGAQAAEVPDEQRIERLKAAIESKTFKIDARAIANAMIDEEQG